MVLFINHILGIQAETLRATVIGLSTKFVTAIKTFHVRLFSNILFSPLISSWASSLRKK